MTTLFRFIAIQTLVTSLALAQWLGYGTSQYLYPDSTSGGLGWRSYSTNGSLSFWDDLNGRITFRFNTNGSITFADGTIQSTAASPTNGLILKSVADATYSTFSAVNTASNALLSTVNGAYVPKTYTINGRALSGSSVTLSGSDLTTGDIPTAQLTSNAIAQPYRVTVTGTNATLAASYIQWADGKASAVTSQTVWLWPSVTNYIGIDLYTKGLRNYQRKLDMATKWVARITTDSSGNVTDFAYLSKDYDAPPCPIERVKRKINSGAPILAVVIGDSISLPYPGRTTNWAGGLFTNTSWSADYLPTASVNKMRDYAVGTTTALMGMAATGRSIPVSKFSGTSGNLGITQPLYAEILGLGIYATSPVLEAGPDIAIVGYFNDLASANLTNKMAYTGAIVRRLRLAGIPVILHCTEPNLGTSLTNWWSHYSEGYSLCAEAVGQGALFLDTQSRCIFHITQGGGSINTFFADPSNPLHPDDLGSLEWIKWMRAALNPNDQQINEKPGSFTLITQPRDGYAQAAFPFTFDFQSPYIDTSVTPAAYATNNTYTSITTSGYGNPAQYVGGINSSTGGVYVQAGSEVIFSHPHALSLNLLLDANVPSIPLAFDIKIGSTIIKSISYSGAGARATVIELLTVDEMRSIASSLYNYGKPDFFDALALKLVFTGGAATIFGAEWGVPSYYDVPISSLDYQGTWNRSFADTGYYGHYIYGTDTGGDNVRFVFRGAGAQLLLQGGTGAGNYTVKLDGQAVTSLNGVDRSSSGYFDGYIGANRFIPVNFFPNSFATNTANFFNNDLHSILITYTGTNNGSAASVTSTKRRLAVAKATVFNSLDIK